MHGTSTPLNDAAEAHAVGKVFAGLSPVVTSTKGVTGHALGAAGAIEAAAVVLSMQHKLVPPTMGLVDYDPELPDLTIALERQDNVTLNRIMSNSFGFGGHNGTIILAPAS